jgi:segregation and condensation protein A
MTDLDQNAMAPDTIAVEVAAWEDPPRERSAAAAPVLSVDGFEGPLDWLLEMVRARQIDLARLSVVALVEAFANAMDTGLACQDNAPAQLVRWGDWLVMAATLAHLRSRLLLPADAPEAKAAVDEAEALRRQLLSRAQMQAAAAWMERQPQLGRDVFLRGASECHTVRRAGDITDLLRACLLALAVPERHAAALRRRTPTFWRVSDAIARIGELLQTLPEGGSLAVFLPEIAGESPDRSLCYRAAISSTLIASLELARDGALALDQDVAWRPIRVMHRETALSEFASASNS